MVSNVRNTTGIGSSSYPPRSYSSLPPPSEAPSLETTVTLSEEALRPRTQDEGLSAAAHADPGLAETLAYDYAHIEQQPLLDITGTLPGGDGIIRYSANGEPVTEESKARFAQQADDLLMASQALYADEKKRGTAAADIVDKLITLFGATPQDFRDKIRWS